LIHFYKRAQDAKEMARRISVNLRKLCLFLVFGTIAYNEYLAYYISGLYWPHVPEGACTLLLVGDPQIQGNTLEPPGLTGSIQRWDSDRYLKNVYSWLSSQYFFATTVFLGDLVDEGSIASDDVYQEYVDRFFSIFPPSATKGSILTPGDNDVGGEGYDLVTLKKLDRYNKAFGSDKLIHSVCPWLDIVPVSRLTEHGTLNITSKLEHLSRKNTIAVISHLPVLPLDGTFAERVMTEINPDVIFSAHDHRGFLYTSARGSLKAEKELEMFSRRDDITPLKIITREPPQKDGPVEMSETMSEIVVPTISYRMGVKEMGAGLAVFNKDGELVYHNLWLPSRFPLLFAYLASLVCVVILTVLDKCMDARKISRRRAELQSTYRQNYQPLLR